MTKAFTGSTEFQTKVYEACRKIPKGKVSTYQAIAIAIGSPKAFRAVGSALKKNPYAPEVPCHRVVASDLSLGGFFGSTDQSGKQLIRKREILVTEGVSLDNKITTTCKNKYIVNEKSLYIF